MKYHLVSAAILLAALILYGLGSSSAGNLAFIVGAVCELWFWLRLFVHRTSPHDTGASNT